MSHKGHPDCPYTSKGRCERARREAIGPCLVMLDENRQCRNLGTDTVDGRAYCGQHINGPYREADERERRRIRKALLNARIDSYLAETGQHAHECGEHCQFSGVPAPQLLVPQPRPEDIYWMSGEEGTGVGIDTVAGGVVRLTDRGYEEVAP